MVKNNYQIEVIFFDIGGVLLHIHPENMIKKISTITNIPFSIVQDSFPHDAHDTYERGQMTNQEWFNSFKTALPKKNNLTENYREKLNETVLLFLK